MGLSQQALNAIRRDDEMVNRGLRSERKNGLCMSIDQRAVLNAVASEGPEILGSKGREYWDDQARMYPHLRVNARSVARASISGRRHRLGRVKERWSYGKDGVGVRVF